MPINRLCWHKIIYFAIFTLLQLNNFNSCCPIQNFRQWQVIKDVLSFITVGYLTICMIKIMFHNNSIINN